MKILVVEDDSKLARLLCRGLEEDRHQVDLASDGDRGLELATSGRYEAVVLDLLLPRRDGLEICRRTRELGLDTPILMLTARDAVPDRVAGLDSGADDYLTKPFAFDELLARLEAITRSPDGRRSTSSLVLGPLRIDGKGHRIWLDDEPVELTVTEYRVLEVLAHRAGRIVARDELLERVWDGKPSPGTRVVDIYLGYLRRKLGPAEPRLVLRSIRGQGVLLEFRPEPGDVS